jgi:WD40 repeat protein
MVIWSLEIGKTVGILGEEGDRIWSIAISNDGKYLAAARGGTMVDLWDLRKRVLVTTFSGHTNQVESVAFDPKGKYLISGSDDGTCQLWAIQ